jgi:hypothetical protein
VDIKNYVSLYKTIIVFSLCFLLSACFDFNQKLIIKDDNTAHYEMEMVFDEKLAGFGDGDICGDINLESSSSLTKTSKKHSSGGNIICTVIIDGPIEEFKTLVLNKKGDDNNSVLITKTGEDTFRISSDYSSMKGSDDDTSGDIAKGMMAAMFAGRAIRWDITAPQIIASNGEISEDGKSVHWELSLVDLFSDSAGDLQFYADVKFKRKWWHWIYDAWYWALSFIYSEADCTSSKPFGQRAA